MDRPTALPRFAALLLSATGFVLAATASSSAQTWRWDYSSKLASGASVAGRSTVAIEGGKVRLAFALPERGHDAIVESCTATVTDVASASLIQTGDGSFLFVRLKPNRFAQCDGGARSAVTLPANDARGIATAANAINASAAGAPPPPIAAVRATPARRIAQVVPTAPPAVPSPVAMPSEAPVRPSPAPTASAAVHARVWTENSGVFSFVRVHNVGTAPVRFVGGSIDACSADDAGCRELRGGVTVGAHQTVTLATLTTVNLRTSPHFNATVILASGMTTATLTASATTRRPATLPAMTDAEMRAAEGTALVALRSAGPVAAPAPFVGPRLVHRGSSRLAIGQKGSADVRLWIAPSGVPERAEIIAITNPKLSAAAIETAVSSTFEPASDRGKPVGAKYVATYRFDGADPTTASIPSWHRASPVAASPLPAPGDATPSPPPFVPEPPPAAAAGPVVAPPLGAPSAASQPAAPGAESTSAATVPAASPTPAAKRP